MIFLAIWLDCGALWRFSRVGSEAIMANKQKGHKGARKRLKLSAKGKVRYRRSFTSHLMSGKNSSRRRKLRRPAYLIPVLARKLRPLLEA